MYVCINLSKYAAGAQCRVQTGSGDKEVNSGRSPPQPALVGLLLGLCNG